VTKAERKKLNVDYAKKIIILQKLDHRGRNKFFILHKRSFWLSPSLNDVPKYQRVRYTLDAAEEVAFHLIKNYEKIFMT
tara:strand:- start:69 stop:305 length:237 start_codon:yes stop_codon:yes gene_type:complete